MSDPFTALAAFASLADISVRSIREIYRFLSALSTASAELRYLQRHLHSLETCLIHVSSVQELYKTTDAPAVIRDVCNDIEEELRLCIDDLAELKILLRGSSVRTKSTLNRFGVLVKSIWQEEKITKFNDRLERRKLYLNSALSTLGRHNDFQLRVALEKMQQNHTVASQEIQQNNKSVLYLVRDVSHTQHVIKNDQRRISRRLLQESSNVRNSIRSARTEDDKLRHTIGAGFCITRKQLKRVHANSSVANKQFSQFSQHVHERISQIDDTLKGLNGLCFKVARDKRDNLVIINGSAERAAASLHLVFSNLPKIFASLNQQPDTFLLSQDDMDWLQSEFKMLLAAVDLEASVELKGTRKAEHFTNKRRPTQPIGIQERFEYTEEPDIRLPDKQSSRNTKGPDPAIELRETKAVIDLFIGKLTLFVSEACPTHHSSHMKRFIDGVRLLFFPRSEMSVCGFAASSTFNWKGQTRIYPLLSTFGVLSCSEPIWKYIEIGDVLNVRQVLTSRRLHPNDRDANYGNSLLGWAAWNHQKDICELLVREGADPLNCDAEGYSALSVFYRAALQRAKTRPCMIEGTRALIKACGGDIVEHDTHIDWKGAVTGVFSHGIVHRAILEMFRSWMRTDCDQPYFESLELLLQSGGDPNERNGWGRTPLLTAAFQVRLSALPKIMRMLLKYGADALLVDDDGEGILHRVLYAFGSCGIKKMDSTWMNDMIDIIVALLQTGCDSSLKKDIGWTPSDNALSPAAWLIWSEALTKVGLQPEDVVTKDDELDGIFWAYGDIDEEFKRAKQLSSDRSKSVLYRSVDLDEAKQPCCICGQSFWWIEKHAPFDFMGMYLNPGLQCHQQIYNHSGGQFCSNYFSRVDCSSLDHEGRLPVSPTPKQLSWRKHIALRLWRDGFMDRRKVFG